jgi:surfeit locus 1 family protein
MSSRTRLILLVTLLLVAAACARLGIWQLGRLRERRAANAVAASAAAQPEIELGRGIAAVAHRRVRAAGEYDHAHQLVLRGQAYREQPGVIVVTPLRMDGEEPAVLVVRGFIPAADAMTTDLDSLREPGRVEVRGTALPLSSRADGGMPLERSGRTTWKGLDRDAIGALLPYPVLDVYVMQTPDSALPSYPRRLAAPALDDGPHLSYAIQWFAFGTIAVVGGVALLGRK